MLHYIQHGGLMNLRKEQFVNLHGHSCFSLFDGFGFPQEHMDFAYENGSRALALTDHGSMNGLSYQLLRAKEMKAGLIQRKNFNHTKMFYLVVQLTLQT